MGEIVDALGRGWIVAVLLLSVRIAAALFLTPVLHAAAVPARVHAVLRIHVLGIDGRHDPVAHRHVGHRLRLLGCRGCGGERRGENHGRTTDSGKSHGRPPFRTPHPAPSAEWRVEVRQAGRECCGARGLTEVKTPCGGAQILQ